MESWGVFNTEVSSSSLLSSEKLDSFSFVTFTEAFFAGGLTGSSSSLEGSSSELDSALFASAAAGLSTGLTGASSSLEDSSELDSAGAVFLDETGLTGTAFTTGLTGSSSSELDSSELTHSQPS